MDGEDDFGFVALEEQEDFSFFGREVDGIFEKVIESRSKEEFVAFVGQAFWKIRFDSDIVGLGERGHLANALFA